MARAEGLLDALIWVVAQGGSPHAVDALSLLCSNVQADPASVDVGVAVPALITVLGATAARPAAASVLRWLTQHPSAPRLIAEADGALAALLRAGTALTPPSVDALKAIAAVAKSAPDLAGAVASARGVLPALAYAATREAGDEAIRLAAREALLACATGAGGAVVTALVPPLGLQDAAVRAHTLELLTEYPLSLPRAAVEALEAAALEAAVLRAEVKELRALPVSTRAAIVELAGAMRAGMMAGTASR
jgi:hypothetical protein